jgi:hypothetical protein
MYTSNKILASEKQVLYQRNQDNLHHVAKAKIYVWYEQFSPSNRSHKKTRSKLLQIIEQYTGN